MASPTIDFQSIRTHHGSQHSGFEELICQLAALETPDDIPFHRKGAGADAGLECYRVERDGSETGWQAKYLRQLGGDDAGQLTKSFDNAVAKHPALARFVVCLPFDLSDARMKNRKSERDRWDAWVKERQTSIAPRVVEIQLWGAFQLRERLSRNDPLHVGRRTYWFDLPHFGEDWFKERFSITRKQLGKRYAPEFNIELPIRQALAAFARDPDLARRIAAWADNLDETRIRYLRGIADTLGTNHAVDVKTLDYQVASISAAIRAAPLGPTDLLPFPEWSKLVTTAAVSLSRCSAAMWELRSQAGGDFERMRNGLNCAHKIYETLDSVAQSIDDPGIRRANDRCLLLTGEAGVGKSHLLADFAESHIKRGFPAILTLGSAFSDGDPWRQIAEQLGLTKTEPDAILGALDAAAEAAGTRALVIVDAINERNGISVWSTRLAAFLAVAARFHHVAVLVSCRTTYVQYIVHDLDDLPRLEHAGFAGKAAEAARRYLDLRGIVRMAAPHFATEFENPLFLRTCCDMLERRGERELPRGLSGVSQVFDFYFASVVEAINGRMGLTPRKKLVEAALDTITKAMIDAGVGYLPLDDVMAMIENIHASGGCAEKDLFTQLENEGLLAVEPLQDGDSIVEMVRFTFERLSDHLIANRLLDTHVGAGDPASAFDTGGALAGYVAGPDSGRFAGIAEALAIQLPERYSVELIDLVPDESSKWDLAHAFQLSLLWRSQSVFTERTLELVRHWGNAMGTDAELATLLAIATEPDNCFNAEHLDRWLRPLSMPERDVQWSTRATRLFHEGDGAINTLIEWVLANGLGQIAPDRARLTAITLAWLTSLSHRWVRDMATKALATLLVDRRELAVDLMETFADIDDAYVIDRVLAAAYGAATRRSTDQGLPELARAAFAAVFARDPLPVHALIRDHARGIIELAASRGVLPKNIPLDRVRPPYPRGAPIEMVKDDTLESYVQDYGNGNLHADEICSSAIRYGDFARYKIDPIGRLFRSPVQEGALLRRWVTWRAHELGWTPERFARFDRETDGSGRMDHRIERIGKKYQWIAYHELVGRLSDIALLNGDFNNEPEPYQGPWQVSAREMDPTILVTKTKLHDSNNQGATWWSPHASLWRADPPKARIVWMEDQSRDIPKPVEQIDVVDPDGRRWLVLGANVGRNHLVMVNGQREIHRATWHKVESVLVAQGDVKRLEQLLRGSANDRDSVSEFERPDGGYLGEYPWHPAFAHLDGTCERNKILIHATTAYWRVERAGHDYSIEEHFDFKIPAPTLMRGLNLRLAEGRSLAYAAADGRVLFKDPSADEAGFSAAIVDRDAMRAFLAAKGLEIVWIFTGEKSAHGGLHGRGWGGMLEYWGIYRFNGDAIQGELNFERRDAQGEQLAVFLASHQSAQPI